MSATVKDNERFIVFCYIQTFVFVGLIVWVSLTWQTPQRLSQEIDESKRKILQKQERLTNEMIELTASVNQVLEIMKDSLLKIRKSLVGRGQWMRDVNAFLKESDRWRLSDEIAYEKAWITEFSKLNPQIKIPNIKPEIVASTISNPTLPKKDSFLKDDSPSKNN